MGDCISPMPDGARTDSKYLDFADAHHPEYARAILKYEDAGEHEVNRLECNNYNYLNILGKGAFGRVVRVQDNRFNHYYAMKIIDKKRARSKFSLEDRLSLRNEAKILNKLRHPNIVRLHLMFDSRHFIFFLLELVEGQTLDVILKEPLSENVAKFIAVEVFLALKYLHRKGVVYRDLKPDNLMIDKNGHCKIIDLGCAIVMRKGDQIKQEIGAVGYKAPEMLAHKPYNRSVDWWGFGILIYYLLTSKHPFHKGFVGVTDKSVLKTKINYPSSMSSDAKSIIKGLLTLEPKARLGCGQLGSSEIQNHPWFSDIDWEVMKLQQQPSPIANMVTPSWEKEEEVKETTYKNITAILTEFDHADVEYMLEEAF